MRLNNLIELTKPRLVALVLWSATVGYLLALPGAVKWNVFCWVLVGVGLVAGGSLALNQWIEQREDAAMPRTAGRPIPSGRVRPRTALWAGIAISLAGTVLLVWWTYPVTVMLALLTWASYLFFYTPLKKITSLNTLVGAVPGAIPPMIGWTAVHGRLSYEAWVLFFILFLWQLPHFLAIAWMYREEYRKAGFIMLSTESRDPQMVARQALIYTAMLVPVSLLPTLVGMCGYFYAAVALLLGIGFIVYGILWLRDVNGRARPMFGYSIIYLSVLLLAMIFDKAGS